MRYSENFQGLFSCQTQDHVDLATRGVTARAIGSTKGDSPAIALSTPGHLAAGNLNFFS